MDSPRRPRASFSKGNVLARGPGTLSLLILHPAHRAGEKEYLGRRDGIFNSQHSLASRPKECKNPMASLAFQGRPGAPKAIHKTHPGQPWKAGPKAVNDAWRSTMGFYSPLGEGWKKDESTIPLFGFILPSHRNPSSAQNLVPNLSYPSLEHITKLSRGIGKVNQILQEIPTGRRPGKCPFIKRVLVSKQH